MKFDETLSELNKNLDLAIEYAEQAMEEDKELCEAIVHNSKQIKTLINDDSTTNSLLGLCAWCMSIGAFIAVVDSPQIVAIIGPHDVPEEPEDESVH